MKVTKSKETPTHNLTTVVVPPPKQISGVLIVNNALHVQFTIPYTIYYTDLIVGEGLGVLFTLRVRFNATLPSRSSWIDLP